GRAVSTISRHQFGGTFLKDADPTPTFPGEKRVLADHFDNDNLADVVLLSPKEATLAITGTNQRQQITLGLDEIDAATTIDFDNDGWLDLAIAGHSGNQRRSLILRTTRGQFAAATETPP